MSASAKSLKEQNFPWLGAVIVLDMCLVAWLMFPGGLNASTLSELKTILKLAPGLVPALVAALTSVFPADVKARLIFFWRFKYPLPGCRAFSVYADGDTRFSRKALEEKIKKEMRLEQIPKDPRRQNVLWYSLFKKVEDKANVKQSHRLWLFFRELAALSALLLMLVLVLLLVLVLAPSAPYILGMSAQVTGVVAGLFAAQYFISVIAGRTNGVRFVTNVFAEYANMNVVGKKQKASP